MSSRGAQAARHPGVAQRSAAECSRPSRKAAQQERCVVTMSWMGPGRRYYYQRRRVGGRIEYSYIGPAGRERTELFAAIDQLDRERRRHELAISQAARAEFAELAATPTELTLLFAEARAEVARVLTEAGYHQHDRGQWRKRRGHKSTSTDEGANP
jgi:hypothetical protein